MSNFRYETINDAEQQIAYTVMMMGDGEPVYIQPYTNWIWSFKWLSRKKDDTMLDIRTAGLSFEPFSLGYLNSGIHAIYVTRLPNRMWKQGLCYDHLKATAQLEDDFLQSESLRRCLLDDYPSLQKAYKRIIDKGFDAMSVAFNKDFCLRLTRKGMKIDYKGLEIGEITIDLNFNIYEKYEYVVGHLTEVIRENN